MSMWRTLGTSGRNGNLGLDSLDTSVGHRNRFKTGVVCGGNLASRIFQEIRMFLAKHRMDGKVTDIQTLRKHEGTHMSIFLYLVHFTMSLVK